MDVKRIKEDITKAITSHTFFDIINENVGGKSGIYLPSLYTKDNLTWLNRHLKLNRIKKTIDKISGEDDDGDGKDSDTTDKLLKLVNDNDSYNEVISRYRDIRLSDMSPPSFIHIEDFKIQNFKLLSNMDMNMDIGDLSLHSQIFHNVVDSIVLNIKEISEDCGIIYPIFDWFKLELQLDPNILPFEIIKVSNHIKKGYSSHNEKVWVICNPIIKSRFGDIFSKYDISVLYSNIIEDSELIMGVGDLYHNFDIIEYSDPSSFSNVILGRVRTFNLPKVLKFNLS